MNLTIDLTQIRTKLIDPLQDAPARMRLAVAIALTKTAVLVRAAERREMQDVFDRPTPFTLNSVFVKPATAANPEARVNIKNDFGGSRSALSWLRWQIRGGLRTLTGFEKALVRAGAMDGGDRSVPGKFARLNAFGNMSPGQMQQILSQLRIETGRAGSVRTMARLSFNDTGKQRKATQGKIRRAYAKAGGQFVAFPYGRGNLRPGLYLVPQTSGRKAPPKLVLLFVSKAEYEAGRFDFDYVAQIVVRRELPLQLSGQLARKLLQANVAPGLRVNLA